MTGLALAAVCTLQVISSVCNSFLNCCIAKLHGLDHAQTENVHAARQVPLHLDQPCRSVGLTATEVLESGTGGKQTILATIATPRGYC